MPRAKSEELNAAILALQTDEERDLVLQYVKKLAKRRMRGVNLAKQELLVRHTIWVRNLRMQKLPRFVTAEIIVALYPGPGLSSHKLGSLIKKWWPEWRRYLINAPGTHKTIQVYDTRPEFRALDTKSIAQQFRADFPDGVSRATS